MESRGFQEEAALMPASKPEGQRGRRLRRLLLIALAVALLLLYLGRDRVLFAAAHFLDVSETPAATDYVMVLGGNVQTRPFAAAALLHAGLARKAVVATILCSGDNLGGILPPEQEVIRSALVREGVSPDAVIILANPCASTFDEARALAEFLESQPPSSVTVVTSCQHTRRTRWIFRRVLGASASQVHFLGVPQDGFDETNWWHFESGICTYLSEYAKLAFYLVHY
jgi:uncharacterized SAM-binding protein YcdF (DUF218 family)